MGFCHDSDYCPPGKNDKLLFVATLLPDCRGGQEAGAIVPHFAITGPGLESMEWLFPSADVFLVGRSHTCALVLPDPYGKVSQTHAAVVRVASSKEEYFVRDLGSRNSTRVGGQGVYQKVLREGDHLDIADYRLIYRHEGFEKSTLSRFRRVATKGSDDGDEAKTIGAQHRLRRLVADRVGNELLEQFAHMCERGSSLLDLFNEFLPRISAYVDADRAFIARFNSRDSREYTEVATFGLQCGDSVDVSGEVFDMFIDRLLSGETVQDHNTLLVPVATPGLISGFLCLDRRDRESLDLSGERRAFLLNIGELAGPCCEPIPLSGLTDRSDELKEWPEGLIGCSAPMELLRKQVAVAAGAKTNVRLFGETGTGKQQVADTLHRIACGSPKPFIDLECAAIPENLAETLLFGSTKGVFTDAVEDKPGMFVEADGGTLFLDDLQNMPVVVRHKLYKVLQEKKVLAVGASRPKAINVFVIAGIETVPNAVEESEITEPAFRHRFPQRIDVPPLRDRPEDIPLLAFYFLDCCAAKEGKRTRSISHPALELLIEYEWPGNVRELRNCIENAVRQNTEIILSSDLPPTVTGTVNVRVPTQSIYDPPVESKASSLRTLAEVEKGAIEASLMAMDGIIDRTARTLKISPQGLRNKMKRHGIPAGYGKSKT